MCGIAGLFRLNSPTTPEDIAVVQRMMDVQIRRGPDDAGLYHDKHVVLGHRRLAIIDLSPAGRQPMSNEDGTIWITYNGEIYNYVELGERLKVLGHGFKSNSDTEVIVHGYEEWGIEELLQKLRGMYAFCLYDKRRDLLYLVRDHAGIKPLYYSITNGILIFASEIKAFKILNKTWQENPDWRIYFLTFGHMPEPYTTLKDVYMLPKGSFLILDIRTQKCITKEYTRLEFSEEIKDSRDAINGVRELFDKAVKRHLISNTPIGVFLSGGIDSSLISLVASQFHGGNLRTLSVVFNEKEYSEEQYQKIVCNKINSKHRSYLVTEKDFINSLDDIFLAMDQPTVDGINTYFISKCAKEEGLKAVLSGIGGDELFGGYPSFNRIDTVWFLRKSNHELFFNLFKHFKNEKLKKLSFLSINNPLRFYLLFRGLFPVDIVAKILDIDEAEVRSTLRKVYIRNNYEMGAKNFASFLESDLYMKNQLLKDTDFMSMWHSVEIRVPFLDRDLMQYAFSIDEYIKFNGSIPKGLLLEAFKDMLPSEIGYRSKMGFTFPFQEWVRDNVEPFSDFIPNRKAKPIRELIRAFKHNKLHWSRFWALILLGMRNGERDADHRKKIEIRLHTPLKHKNILCLVPELFKSKGGIQVFNNYLINSLIDFGCTLNVASINDSGNTKVLPYSFSTAGRLAFLKKPVFIWNILKQTITFKPDLIICGHINFSPLCALITTVLRIPYLTITHGVDAWSLSRLKVFGLKHSKNIISVSRFTRSRILAQLPAYPKENILILPNTVDSERFNPQPKSTHLMKRLGIGKDEKILLTIARLSKSEKYKGYDKVLLALGEVLKEIPNIKYILGGKGDDLKRIKKLIKENNLGEKVILTGFIPDEELVDYYNVCDVFVMPSKKEGFGIVFIEALACGKPVIAGNKDGSVDAVLDGELGILVDPDNGGEIKHAIIKVLKGDMDKKLLDGEYLRQRTLEAYGLDKFRERTKELIEKVAS